MNVKFEFRLFIRVSSIGGEVMHCRRFVGAREAVPPFQFTQNTVFGTSRHDKTTDNDGNIRIKAGSHRTRQRLRHRSVTVQRSTVIWR